MDVRRRAIALAILASSVLLSSALVLNACGDSGANDSPSPSAVQPATLILDYLPGPVHAGVYYALEQGYYQDEGIDLEIIPPTSTSDTLKLIAAGKADFGIADGIDVAGQIDQGQSAKGIMAVTQKPAGSIITRVEDNIETPADLNGKTIGWSGVPSDKVAFEQIMEGGGGDPDSCKIVTIGYNGAQNLTSGKIAGFLGYANADGVALDLDGVPTRSFMLDDYGGPEYPGLVVFSTEESIASEPELMQGFVTATIKGYEGVIQNPQAGIDALLKYEPTIPADFAKAGLDATMPMFLGTAPSYGVFQMENVAELITWLSDSNLIETFSPERYATNEFTEE